MLDVLLLGDFNRHDQLWGGDEVSLARQGEADPIIDLMTHCSLRSLLQRGTKTWERGESAITIDLVLASEDLANVMIRCVPCQTEHGQRERLLLKSAPWKEINARIERMLLATPVGETVQQKTDLLSAVVSEAVHALSPKAKPSPYAKRWWTEDLAQLRLIYTYWRSWARSERRAGFLMMELQQTAKDAASQYRNAIRKQKRTHWEQFLTDKTNIWKAAQYLELQEGSAFGKIPELVRADGTRTNNTVEQTEELISRFFPPLPSNIKEETGQVQRTPIAMPDITLEEIERQLFATKPWKAPGVDGLPAIVWRQTWPAVQHRVVALFRQSLHEGELPSQWRHAKIIPLKKPGKADCTLARAWRPI